jgi:hypothetical protein
MKHLLEFESYGSINESVPLYNFDKFQKHPSSPPESNISQKNLIRVIQNLVEKIKDGRLSEVTMTVDLPRSGKNAPKHATDYLEAERKRIDKMVKSTRGSRLEAADTPEDEGIYGGEQTSIFFDSEYILIDFTEDGSGFKVVGIPYSKKRDAYKSPDMMNYYTTIFEPEFIEEIFYKD